MEAVVDDAHWRERVGVARRRGDHLMTFDLACEGLAACPDSLPLHYAAILALARSGATRGARDRLDRLRDKGVLDDIPDRKLALDVACLAGRLEKDTWARSDGDAARASAKRSAEAYAEAFERFGTHYPAINAATMFLAGGDADRARRFAGHALEDAAAEPGDYWACASAAEASLILGDARAAGEWLERAAAFAPGLDDVASTRRQILFVARTTGAAEAVVDLLPAPPVRFWLDDGAEEPASRLDDSPEQPASRLDDSLEEPASPGIATWRERAQEAPPVVYGTFVDLADVARATRLAAAGAEINLVLPCERPAWLEARGGEEAERVRPALEHLLEVAANVVYVTREGRPDDPAALDLCRRQVRGLARLRARAFAVAAGRIVWGGDPAAEPEIRPDDDREARPHREAADIDGATASGGREPRAIVFGDVRGFSKLGESDQLRFLDRIMGGFADVLAVERAVDYAETAGDGIYVVLGDVESAARCCFGLRDVLDPARVAAAGLPPHLGLRLSAHVGPLYRRLDRVIGRIKFCGSEVIRTARIEPVTPLGEIYVTEQFAAALADVAGEAYACDYAGRQPMAKGFGSCRMYALRRSRG